MEGQTDEKREERRKKKEERRKETEERDKCERMNQID